MTDPYARTPQGLLQRILQRVQSLEERLARILPGRLGALGQETTDWNYATDNGWYWGNNAANQPDGGVAATHWVGMTQNWNGGQKLIQILWRPDAPAQNYRIRCRIDGVWSGWTTNGPDALRAGVTSGGVVVNATTPGAILTGNCFYPAVNYPRMVTLTGVAFAQGVTDRVDVYLQINGGNIVPTSRVGLAFNSQSVSIGSNYFLAAGASAAFRLYAIRVGSGAATFPGDASLTYLETLAVPI